MSKDAYALSGVDVDVEAKASQILYEASKETFKNRKGLIGDVVQPHDDFASLKMIAVENLPKGSFFSVGFDTAGTKVEIAERVGKYDTIAFDVLAMVCDDALLRGGEPVLVGTNLDVKTLGIDESKLGIIRELASGYVKAAHEANVAIINGELAQMGSLINGYGDFPFHWGAACVWFAKKERILTGMEIEPGDSVVALKENGFRCNGWSLIRKIMQEAHGEQWHTVEHEGQTLGERALTPSVIYSKLVVGIHGGFDSPGFSPLRGVAHITGGGLPEKMSRMLRVKKLGVVLDNLFDPPEITAYTQKLGTISDNDAYRAWNMGQGMALITSDPDTVLAECKKSGMDAQVAGRIVSEPIVSVVSKGMEKKGQTLTYAVA